MIRRLLLTLALFAPAAHAQFQLFVLNGSAESPVPPICDLGRISAGDLAAAQFRIRNTSTAPASINTMILAGVGFTLPKPPILPLTLAPQQAFDFVAQFTADIAGSYSAVLTVPGTSIILTATIVPGLTYRIPATVDFGVVERGSTAVEPFVIENRSTQPIVVPPVLLRGDGFSLSGQSPADAIVNPQQAVSITLAFAPTGAGAFSGTLSIGDRIFSLAGAGIDSPLPKPVLSVDLPQCASGQQGTARVNFDNAARAAGSGTLTLDFQPSTKGAADPAIAFASGGRSIAFTIRPGDTQPLAASFQTGSTAGTLTFTATIGTTTAQSTIYIAPAPVAVVLASATRTPGGLVVQLTGSDNTRTAGGLVFTFYDRAGNAIGAPVAANADFPTFFQSSDVGGVFALKASFPVTGDTSQVAAVEAQLTNTAGITNVARVAF